MKILSILIAVFFVLAPLPFAMAEDAISVDFVYTDMEELFAQALTANILEGDRKSSFEQIISLYEGTPGVQNHKYATYFYCYASGYLAFLQEDWSNAKIYFDKCRIYNMGEEEMYYCFTMGMLYAENGNYAGAISMFDAAASSGGTLSSRALNKSLECTRLYQDSLRDSGKAAQNAGDYQSALAYFDALRTQFPESDGAQLYESCLILSDAAGQRDELSISSVGTVDAQISWVSAREDCLLLLTTEMGTRTKYDGIIVEASDTLLADAPGAVNAWSIKGGSDRHTARISGLLPGTTYALWMEDPQTGEALCGTVFVTESASAHPRFGVDRSVLYAYQQVTYDMTRAALKENAAFWTTFSDSLQMQAGYDIPLSASAAGSTGHVLIFRAIDADGNVLPLKGLEWGKLTLLLHIGGVATICHEEAFDDPESVLEVFNEELSVLRVNDILRSAARSYAIPAGIDYRLSVLLDGQLFLEISGNLG